MKIQGHFTALFAGLLTATACAQSAPQPLNLKLPPESMASESPATPPREGDDSAVAGPVAPAPSSPAGVPYDVADSRPRNPEAAAVPACDDATYGQPRVHGSATVGVVAGNHASGNYQDGVVNITKAFGSCDRPAGGVSFTVDVGRGNFSGRRHGWR